MVIDCHVHLNKDDVNADKLVAEADRLAVDRLVVFATGYHRGGPYNRDMLGAAERHPERIIPFAHFRLGADTADRVSEFARQGFRGMKLINPASDYNDRGYWPVYERAQEEGLVLLFHLGVVAVHTGNPLLDVDTGRMRPVHLDPILRRFPDLVIFGAHMGNPWYDEAGMLCRWHKNLYFDLSGSSLKKKKPEFFRELLWWSGQDQYKDPLGRDPWEKILFGTDVAIKMMGNVKGDYERHFEALDLAPELRAAVMGNTAAGIFGLEEG